MWLQMAQIDNDTRGWIMTIVSGVACIFGASIVCVDSLVRHFPGMHNFRIQDSSIFLASSLSLSFGVMLFSGLYSMLPESKGYLIDDGWSDRTAGLIMMACFIGGFIGIQAVSRLLHQFMPSHVVDCDHSHEDKAPADEHETQHIRKQSRASRARRRVSRPPQANDAAAIMENGHSRAMESTPLLDAGRNGGTTMPRRHASVMGPEMTERPGSPLATSRTRATTGVTGSMARRPSIFQVPKRVMSFVKDTKSNCDESGSCYGYTDPCGQECFKHLSGRSSYNPRNQTIIRTTTGPFYSQNGSIFHRHRDDEREESPDAPHSPRFRTSRATSRDPMVSPLAEEEEDFAVQGEQERHEPREMEDCEHYGSGSIAEGEDADAQHHHHVPTNAFLSIGLQTSIAIALHKFPEGFVTYATNHANPTLGFNVFMALFVHNISEGFAMCLPLYMALGSRWRAMTWSAVLGGLSQPFGAALAALWFKLASRSHMAPNAVAYACLFATTAGIMVSVALQLFVESLSLNHDRNLCIFFGFLGMAILGLSNALFASH